MQGCADRASAPGLALNSPGRNAKCLYLIIHGKSLNSGTTLHLHLSPALQHHQNNARSICVSDRKHHITPQFSSSLLQDEAI